MTAIGPLTTTFAAPSSCGSLSVYQLWKGSQSTYVQGPLYTAGSDNACFPDDYNPSGYYSPGICPQGYTTACSKLSTKSKVTETAVVCCPPAIIEKLAYTCVDEATADATLGCTLTWSAAAVQFTATAVRDGSINIVTTVVNEGGLAAYGVRVRFTSAVSAPPVTRTSSESSQTTGSSATITSPPLTTPTTDPSTVTTTSSPLGSDPSTPQPDQKSGGVSTTAAIGIGVGSAIAALLIVSSICFFFFLRWRRKRHGQAPLSMRSPQPPEDPLEPLPLPLPSPPPVPPKEPYQKAGPRYELSEEFSPRPDEETTHWGRYAPRESMFAPTKPAELEAVVPSEAPSEASPSIRDRGGSPDTATLRSHHAASPDGITLRGLSGSPDSGNSQWTRQKGGMPMPWL